MISAALTSVLPNMRWIGVASEALGEDWYERSLQIDHSLSLWNMELAEESVYLQYDRSPGAVMHGEGTCLVARSVIGPKKSPPSPFKLLDWTAMPVFRQKLSSKDWPRVFEEAFFLWQDLQRKGSSVCPDFILCLRRRLTPELSLETEVIFRE